mgnify:CR=1 FL=1
MIKNSYLIIIPARSTSKSIKNKNLQKIGKNTLVDFKIKLAKYVFKNKNAEIILSTDSKHYQKYFKKKIKVPFIRPKSLARDTTESKPVLIHAINFYKKKNYFFDYVVLLEPPTPFLLPSSLNRALKLLDNEKLDLIVSLTKSHISSNFLSKLNSKQSLTNILRKISSINKYRRQAFFDEYSMDGGFYIFSTKYLAKYKKLFVYNKNIKSKGIPVSAPQGLNIESKDDLKYARLLFKFDKKIKKFFNNE